MERRISWMRFVCFAITVPVLVLLMAGTLESQASKQGAINPHKAPAAAKAGAAAKAAASSIAGGKEVVRRNNCLECHSIGGQGGCLAPYFDGIAGRRGQKYIIARISNSQKAISDFTDVYKVSELMPHLRLEPSIAEKVASYLMTIPAPAKEPRVIEHKISSAGGQASKHESSAASIEDGKKLFYSKGCMECHSVGGAGGALAPALDGISSRRSRDYVLARINNAELLALGVGDEYQEKGTMMPPSSLTPEEIESVTDFLMSIPKQK